jgi:hypothetical protein
MGWSLARNCPVPESSPARLVPPQWRWDTEDVDYDELLRRLDAHMERGNEIMARSDLTMRRSSEVMLRNEVAFRDLSSFLAEQTLAMRELTRQIRSWGRVDGNGSPAA